MRQFAAVPASQPRPGRAGLLLLLAGAAVAFGLLDAFQMRAQWAFTGYPGGTGQALLAAIPPWLVLVLLAPGVWFLAQRARLDGARRRRALLVHGAASIAFAAVHVGLQAANAVSLGGYHEGFAGAVGHLAGFYFVSRVVIYWTLLAGAHAVLIYREAQAREVAASRLDAQLQAARVDALRAQLNPHFLFNALNGLSALALRGDREAVADGLARVCDMLRLTLDGRRQEVSLQEELDLTDRFLALQRLRFGDRLRVRCDVSPDAVGALVPSMVLQPLVENALEHGIARVPGPGTLTIRGARDADRLRIEVADTGRGFARRPGDGRGIGLSNTRERLTRLYGDAASVVTANAPAGGAIVTVILPYRQ